MYRVCQHELYDSVVAVNDKCHVNQLPNEYNFYMLSGVNLKVVNFEKNQPTATKALKLLRMQIKSNFLLQMTKTVERMITRRSTGIPSRSSLSSLLTRKPKDVLQRKRRRRNKRNNLAKKNKSESSHGNRVTILHVESNITSKTAHRYNHASKQVKQRTRYAKYINP